MYTPDKTNDEIKNKRNTFSLVSDVDFEKIVFFNAELNFLINNFSLVSSRKLPWFYEHMFTIFKTKH